MKRLILLMTTFMIITLTANVAAVNMECFKQFHTCNVENRGKLKFCSDEKKACEAGKKSTPGTAADKKPVKADRKRALNNDCFHAFHQCNVENRGEFKYCADKRKVCEENKKLGIESTPHDVQKEPLAAIEAEQQPAVEQHQDLSVSPIQQPPVASRQTEKEEDQDLVCFTISMAQKSCIQQPSAHCKRFSNTFSKKSDCDTCFTNYRKPMEKHMLTIYLTAQKVKICKPYKRDNNALTTCQKTVADKNERDATLAYLNAQKEIDHIVAEAKSSGIPACGNFSRIY